MFQIDVCNRQSSLPIDAAWLRQVVTTVLDGESIGAAEISLAVVSDSEIHALNRRFLQHDEATDVLSFLLRDGECAGRRSDCECRHSRQSLR